MATTSLPVDRLTATDCNAAARANILKPDLPRKRKENPVLDLDIDRNISGRKRRNTPLRGKLKLSENIVRTQQNLITNHFTSVSNSLARSTGSGGPAGSGAAGVRGGGQEGGKAQCRALVPNIVLA